MKREIKRWGKIGEGGKDRVFLEREGPKRERGEAMGFLMGMGKGRGCFKKHQQYIYF